MLASNPVLKTGLIGYLYRWLRNAGALALAGGFWLMGSGFYYASRDGHAQARLTRVDVTCQLRGDGFWVQAITLPVECSEADLVRARYSTPLKLEEIGIARLIFRSEAGVTVDAHLPLADLGEGAKSGDTVAITYEREAPEKVRPAASGATYLKGAQIVLGGLLALLLAGFMRWAAAWRGDVDSEVAALRKAHAARTGRGAG